MQGPGRWWGKRSCRCGGSGGSERGQMLYHDAGGTTQLVGRTEGAPGVTGAPRVPARVPRVAAVPPRAARMRRSSAPLGRGVPARSPSLPLRGGRPAFLSRWWRGF